MRQQVGQANLKRPGPGKKDKGLAEGLGLPSLLSSSWSPLYVQNGSFHADQASGNKLAASTASLDCVKFQAVIKSAACAASLRGGRASGRLDHAFFAICWAR